MGPGSALETLNAGGTSQHSSQEDEGDYRPNCLPRRLWHGVGTSKFNSEPDLGDGSMLAVCFSGENIDLRP